MMSRSFLLPVLIGIAAHIVVGTVLNLLSYFPLRNAIATGTLGDPLPLFFGLGLGMGLLGLMIDGFTGLLRGRGGGLAGALAHLTGGFVNGLVALVVLYFIFQQLINESGSSVQGLAESYYGFLLLVATAGSVVGWLAGVAAGAVAGAVGARLRQNRPGA